MPTYTTPGHIVDLQRIDGLGATWIVRVYRKRPIFKKLISSDWFLDEKQAERFVSEIRDTIDRNDTAALLAERRPGWILRRAQR